VFGTIDYNNTWYNMYMLMSIYFHWDVTCQRLKLLNLSSYFCLNLK